MVRIMGFMVEIMVRPMACAMKSPAPWMAKWTMAPAKPSAMPKMSSEITRMVKARKWSGAWGTLGRLVQ
ncbi:hypothetical protein D3C72_2303360 [compost metagenome]